MSTFPRLNEDEDSYQLRQWAENFSKSLVATPIGVTERFRPPGGGVGLPPRCGLILPGDVGGLSNRLTEVGLVGGDREVAEGRS